jgi:hypothetical protein
VFNFFESNQIKWPTTIKMLSKPPGHFYPIQVSNISRQQPKRNKMATALKAGFDPVVDLSFTKVTFRKQTRTDILRSFELVSFEKSTKL